MGAGAEGRQLPRDRLMQQRHPDLDAEDLGLELEGSLRLSGLIEDGDLGHRYSAFRCRCWAFVSLTLFRTTTRLPMGPGTAPRTTRRFCSGNTRMTRTFSTVRRSPPIRPGRWWPAQTRGGSDEGPIDP